MSLALPQLHQWEFYTKTPVFNLDREMQADIKYIWTVAGCYLASAVNSCLVEREKSWAVGKEPVRVSAYRSSCLHAEGIVVHVSYLSLARSAPRWGTADAEIKVPAAKNHTAAYHTFSFPCCQKFYIFLSLPFWLIQLHFTGLSLNKMLWASWRMNEILT